MNVNKIVENTFAGSLKMLNPMMGVGSHASPYKCAYCISLFKPQEFDAPLKTLNFNARQYDKL